MVLTPTSIQRIVAWTILGIVSFVSLKFQEDFILLYKQILFKSPYAILIHRIVQINTQHKTIGGLYKVFKQSMKISLAKVVP